MPDQSVVNFSGPNEAWAQIRAAVSYLIERVGHDDRADVISRIITIANEMTANETARGQANPLDEGMPGG